MIHKYRYGNMMLVLDVNSGAVHVFDTVAFDVLDYYKEKNAEEIILLLTDRYSEDQITEALDEILLMEKEGLLYTEDTYAEQPSIFNREPVIKALCLHIAHDCNIRCKYCFASQGGFGGARNLMDEKVGYKAIDFLIEHSGNRKNLEVDFFGGEPLMNFDVVKKIVAYGKEREKQHNKRFRFTITTNGLLLDEEIIHYINENMDNVVLSIDGRKTVNDNMRFTINGNGTYDLIVPKFKKLVDERKEKSYFVRGTYTRDNLDFSKDVLHLVEIGFKNTSVEPVVTDNVHEYAIKDKDLPKIFEQYDLLADEYIKRYHENRFNFFHFQIDLNQGPCITKRISGCGAGSEYLAITPEGEIFPCHQFVGQKQFSMGNIMDNSFDDKLTGYFKNAHVYSKTKCQSCWAKFYCSGGCHANSYNFHKDIHQPYELGCEMEKKRIECSLAIQAKLFLNKDVKI